MELKRLTRAETTAGEVVLTFADAAGEEHAFTIRPAAVRPMVDALIRLLARAVPAPGLALDIVAARVTPDGTGVDLRARDGLRVTLVLGEEGAVSVAAAATEMATATRSGRVH